MDVNTEKLEAAKACFDYNENLYTVNVTSDLNCFGKRGDAINHARTLTDNSIEVFERDAAAGAVSDDEQTEEANDEVTDIPDLSLAVVKAQGGAKDKKFNKTPAPDPAAEYAAAKPLFSELYRKWNTLTIDQQDSQNGKKLHDQLDKLHEFITKYEADNAPVVVPGADSTGTPAADPAAGTPVAGSPGIVGADGTPATVVDPVADPAAGTPAPAPAPVANYPIAGTPARAADNSLVIAKLDEIVDTVEHLLGLDKAAE